MGKKSRRSGHPARVMASRSSPADRARQSKAGAARDGSGLTELFETTLAEVRATVASGDLLKAEVQASMFAATILMPENSADDYPERAGDLSAVLVNSVMAGQFTPESAAFCRLLVALGSPVLKSEASKALKKHTAGGVYPPGWVADAGKAVAHRAWRGYDVFGDEEFIIITFGYGDTEHAVAVAVDLTLRPAVRYMTLSLDADKLLKAMRDRDDQFQRMEEITLAQARHHLDGPLARAHEDLNPDVSVRDSSFMYIPLVRSRMRRLPVASPGAAGKYTAGDRAAAVDDFLRSPQARSAGGADAARFWAEVLTGYSGQVPGQPPAQVGPGKLSSALLWHVARTFTLTEQQRAGIRPAVTAWTRWAAGLQGLDEAAAAHVIEYLEKIFGNFDSAYDEPDNVTARDYVRDLVLASDVDAAWLADCRDRREFAVPLPEDRQPGREGLSAADHDHRAVIWVSEFALCYDGDVPREEFVPAVRRVMDELWHGDPPATWQAAKRLRATGMSRHEIVHALAK